MVDSKTPMIIDLHTVSKCISSLKYVLIQLNNTLLISGKGLWNCSVVISTVVSFP